jgi:hypothetical protein
MAEASAVSSADWTVGSAIGTAASTLFGHFVPFAGTALVASLPGLLFSLAVPEASGASSIVDMIVGQIVTVTLVYGTIQALRGRRVAIGESLSQGLKRLGPAIGIAIVSGVGIGLASLLLLVPGLILATMWAVAIPAATIEQLGVNASFARSVELTRERRWRVFWTIVVTFVVMIAAIVAAAALLGVIAAWAMTENSPLFLIYGWVVTAVAQAFYACVVATLYYFLRREKEGVDIEQIASVFD